MKQVTLYQCSFCTRTFFREDECFLHECSSHHEIAARQAAELKKYCAVMCNEGPCGDCQFFPTKGERCLISGKPCEWPVADKKEENPQDDDEL